MNKFMRKLSFLVFIGSVVFSSGTAVAETYACNGFRWDDGSGSSKVIKFIYSENEVSIGGLQLTPAGGVPAATVSGFSREVYNQSQPNIDDYVYILSPCTAEGENLWIDDRYKCKQHDILAVSMRYQYPRFPDAKNTRCKIF
jgi:hypothetical protein